MALFFRGIPILEPRDVQLDFLLLRQIKEHVRGKFYFYSAMLIFVLPLRPPQCCLFRQNIGLRLWFFSSFVRRPCLSLSLYGEWWMWLLCWLVFFANVYTQCCKCYFNCANFTNSNRQFFYFLLKNFRNFKARIFNLMMLIFFSSLTFLHWNLFAMSLLWLHVLACGSSTCCASALNSVYCRFFFSRVNL